MKAAQKNSESKKRKQDLQTWLHMGCDKKFSIKFWKEKLFSLGFANLHSFSEAAVDKIPDLIIVGEDATETEKHVFVVSQW